MYISDYNQINNNIIKYYSEATYDIKFTWQITK